MHREGYFTYTLTCFLNLKLKLGDRIVVYHATPYDRAVAIVVSYQYMTGDSYAFRIKALK